MNALPTTISPALKRIGQRLLLAKALLGLGQWLGPVLGGVLALCALDNLLHLPAGLRLVALFAGLALIIFGFVVRLLRPVRRHSLERTAVLLEEVAGVSDNVVINACQFERLALAGALAEAQAVFVRRTLIGGQAVVETVPWSRLCRLRTLAAWLLVVAVAGLAWSGYWLRFPDHARNALIRLALPLADVPPLGAVALSLTPSGDLTIYDGESLSVQVIAVPVDHAAGPPAEAPVLVRAEGVGAIDESLDAGERVALPPSGHDGRSFATTFANVRRSFTFRVACAGTWSRGVTVTVLPLPALRSARFVVDGPDYTGVKAQERPGPPASLAVLSGSRVRLAVICDQPLPALEWRLGEHTLALTSGRDGWSGTALITAAATYALVIPASGGAPQRIIAQGTIQLDGDHPPQIELVTADRNRFVNPDERVALDVVAGDDVGLAQITVTARESAEQSATWEVKTWGYLGPPGNPGPVREKLALRIDAARFVPGKSYLIEATARDYAPPSGQQGRSTPVVLRVRALADLALAAGDPLAVAFSLLKEAIAAEQRARGVTGNVTVNLEEIRKHHTVERQAKAMAGAQEAARAAGEQALKAFVVAKDDSTIASLKPLVEGAMTDVRNAAGTLTDDQTLAAALERIAARQDDIIGRLIALLGAIAERGREHADARKPGDKSALVDGEREKLHENVQELKDDLERFIRDQQRILERSKTLAENGPGDLTTGEDKILGELAKEEDQWAKFLQEKLTDFSKLPSQDFADGKMSQEFNQVWQDIKAAAAALDQKKTELAVPGEQAGLELAEKIENNLERWMAESADNTKWSMEEPKAPADVPLAELPKELEDIIGDLLDQEKDMTDDVQDVSSSWNDSIDKGAGWGAGDGPISNMSAKGITGNSIPNKNEVGGRSGEGRNGRSSGQMVEDTATGKGGPETPTRLSPSPFEQGSVKDEDKKGNGGATGGGKVAGFSAEGLQGPTPPPAVKQALARLAGKQAQIKQKASDLALKLRAQHLPSGDLESAVQAMNAVEDAARTLKGGVIKGRYSQALDSLGEARQAVAGEGRLQRERSKLPERVRQEVMNHAGDAVPPGYEDMAGRYFQALAGAQAEPVK